MKHIISLGAGVQSSTMALMAAAGEITPMPDGAIFADTMHEPKAVYEWLSWLEPRLPFPVWRVSAGDLAETVLQVRTSKGGRRYTKAGIPAFTDNGGRAGMMPRQCTTTFKVEPIQRKLREIRQKQPITQWIGISTDEAHRMKPARPSWLTNRWPLVDLGMRRSDCLIWMEDRGFPKPPRSACVFCPYHSNEEWRRLRDEAPDDFDAAIRFEKRLVVAMAQVDGISGVPYLHRGLRPIGETDLSEPLLPLFGNECEGLCGN